MSWKQCNVMHLAWVVHIAVKVAAYCAEVLSQKLTGCCRRSELKHKACRFKGEAVWLYAVDIDYVCMGQCTEPFNHNSDPVTQESIVDNMYVEGVEASNAQLALLSCSRCEKCFCQGHSLLGQGINE